MRFEPGDEVWYMGRGREYNEPSKRIDTVICFQRPDGVYVVGNPVTGSALYDYELHHRNALVRLAREAS